MSTSARSPAPSPCCVPPPPRGLWWRSITLPSPQVGALPAMGNFRVSAPCPLAGGKRLFRIDRIRQAVLTGAHFPPHPAPAEPGVRYTPGAEDAVVRLRLAPGAAG